MVCAFPRRLADTPIFISGEKATAERKFYNKFYNRSLPIVYTMRDDAMMSAAVNCWHNVNIHSWQFTVARRQHLINYHKSSWMTCMSDIPWTRVIRVPFITSTVTLPKSPISRPAAIRFCGLLALLRRRLLLLLPLRLFPTWLGHLPSWLLLPPEDFTPIDTLSACMLAGVVGIR